MTKISFLLLFTSVFSPELKELPMFCKNQLGRQRVAIDRQQYTRSRNCNFSENCKKNIQNFGLNLEKNWKFSKSKNRKIWKLIFRLKNCFALPLGWNQVNIHCFLRKNQKIKNVSSLTCNFFQLVFFGMFLKVSFHHSFKSWLLILLADWDLSK